MKKTVLLLVLCLLLIGTVGCRKIIPFEKNEPTIPDGENSIPDIPEEGVDSPAVKTVEYNGNLYYIQDDAICKKTLDGEILTVKQKTPGIFYAQVCVVSDWLYYISASYTDDNLFSLNRVDLNGGNDTELLNSKEFIDSPTEGYRSYRVDGGKVYLQTNFKFYRYDIGSDTVEKLTDNVSVYQIVGDRLYFIDSFNRTFTVYCMDLNTLGTSIVLGDGLYHPDKTADVLYKNFVFIGEDLYVLTRNPEGIYKCKDGKTAELISNGTVYDYFLSGQDGMLWYLEKPDHGLWVLKQYDPVTKQSSEIATVDDMASSPELIGNRFYYRDSEQNLREIVLKRERYYSKEDSDKYIIQTSLYQIYEEGEQEYRYRIGTDQKVLVEDVKHGTEPQIEVIKNGIVRLFMGFGTNAFSVQYFDVWEDRISEVFSPYSIYADFADAKTNEYLIAYFDPSSSPGNPVLRIEDIFNQQGFSAEVDRGFISATCNRLIFLNENEIYLDYDVFADGYSNDDLLAGKPVEFKNIREVVKFR